jgi:hypothetical protein
MATIAQNPVIAEATAEAWKNLRKRLAERTVDEALANVKGTAKAEVDSLSESTREDLRLQLLESLDREERDIWASVMTMQSSERFSTKLVTATWGLVAATVGLVIATVILVIVTVVTH